MEPIHAKLTEDQEKEAMANLAFALYLTLQQLSSLDQKIVLGQYVGLTPGILVGWSGRELAALMTSTLSLIQTLMVCGGLVERLPMNDQERFLHGLALGMIQSEN